MSKKNNSFVAGALVIALSNIIVKIIGGIYKIPLDTFILGKEGIGIYSASYTIYNLLFVISTAGLPVAISKMIAESIANDDYKKAETTFSVAKRMLFIVGLISSFIMFFGSKTFAGMINAPKAYLTTMVMAPSLFFVSIASAYRGYYQGQQNMYPTAISEIIEALCKLIFGLSIAYIAKQQFNQYHISSAGAISGITIGTLLSVIFLIVYNFHDKKKKKTMTFPEFKNSQNTEPRTVILKKLIKIAIPITIGASVFTLTSFIDMATVMNTLAKLGYNEEGRTALYGYLNRAITLFNMPPTIINGLSIAIVPFIASFIVQNKKEEAKKNIRSALKITIALALPCGIGLSVLAEPIFELLYRDSNHWALLTIMGIAVIFVTLVQISNAILQSLGKVWIPVINMLIGGTIKIIINLVLVAQPDINIHGAPIGTLACYIMVMSLNLIWIHFCTKTNYGFKDFIIKPVILALTTALTSYLTYTFVCKYVPLIVSTVLTIGITALIYFIVLFIIKALGEDEIVLLPKGEKLLATFKKFKIM